MFLYITTSFIFFANLSCSDKNDGGQDGKMLQFANKKDMELNKDTVNPSSDDLTLSCLAIGAKPIRYKWYKNNALLLARRVDSSLETDKPELKLKDLVRSDSATYKCVVENNYSTISYSFKLSVQGTYIYTNMFF